MTQVDPLAPSRSSSTRAFCASCGHSEAVHSNRGNLRCLRSECDCNGLIVGARPDLSAQVLPPSPPEEPAPHGEAAVRKYDPDSPRYCLPPAQVARGLRG